MILFTQEELELLKVDQLKRLCRYYDIEVFKSWGKQKLIQEILEYQKPPGYISLDTLPMSERVKRIYQSIHSKEA